MTTDFDRLLLQSQQLRAETETVLEQVAAAQARLEELDELNKAQDVEIDALESLLASLHPPVATPTPEVTKWNGVGMSLKRKVLEGDNEAQSSTTSATRKRVRRPPTDPVINCTHPKPLSSCLFANNASTSNKPAFPKPCKTMLTLGEKARTTHLNEAGTKLLAITTEYKAIIASRNEADGAGCIEVGCEWIGGHRQEKAARRVELHARVKAELGEVTYAKVHAGLGHDKPKPSLPDSLKDVSGSSLKDYIQHRHPEGSTGPATRAAKGKAAMRSGGYEDRIPDASEIGSG
ncbi:hypothetical protein FB45DRAFT_859126 [Roridomyces roridus]|uniref:Uncharacterized protein n=1 Tax=Roridomyces roridus TaxID=1738132 RepID=A0AAD7G2E4_9AGAR|nr:hypothetical protein FB45DRAFT_859126 [Roridomyces roridus]